VADRLVWTLVLCALDVVAAAAPAAAQSAALSPMRPVIPVEAPSLLPSRDFVPSFAPAPLAPPSHFSGFTPSLLPVFPSSVFAPSHRPRPLVPMYASFATLQALDYHSTTRALASGAGREANPLMRPIVDNHAAFIAMKAAATTAIVFGTERMWKTHPRRAVVFMAVANSAMAVVVAHNYSVK